MDNYFTLTFFYDKCGWAARSRWHNESESITNLNADLEWHKASQIPSEHSKQAGKNPKGLLKFQSEEDFIDFFVSIKFAQAFAKTGRPLRDLDELALSEKFIRSFVDAEIISLVRKNVEFYLSKEQKSN